MDTNRQRQAAQWYYQSVYQDEPIFPRREAQIPDLPPLLRQARELAQQEPACYESREQVFVKQGRLLARYEDDAPWGGDVVRYYPTYQSFTDQQLRGYFTWRTRLRQGNLEKTCLSFAFLYIYELLNQIGVATPSEGYEKLCWFRDRYGALDGKILPYLNAWITDYAVYYNLPATLLAQTEQVCFDRQVRVFSRVCQAEPEEILAAVKALAPRWLDRSKFYAAYGPDFDQVLIGVLREMSRHYSQRCKQDLTASLFGPVSCYPIRLFSSAVFWDSRPGGCREYVIDSDYRYTCENGRWYAARRNRPPMPNGKLGNLLKAIDALMRQAYHFASPVQYRPEPKWITQLIGREIQALLAQAQARETATVRIDYGRLDQIRRDAAETQQKLEVEEAEEAVPGPEPPPTPEPLPQSTPADLPWDLTPAEYRLLQSLLWGGDLSWISAQGLLLSVLADSVNEKLYDTFLDTVLTMDDQPQVVEDYIDDLKEMVHL